MIFTSLDFSIFLPIAFLIFWMLPKIGKSRNLFLLLASYYFYAAWDWRFLGLIVFSTLLDFFIGKNINGTARKDQILLFASLLSNLSLLFYFKYCNFFLESFVATFALFGNNFTVNRLDVILPVGISFYTFQTLSYIIDIYRKKIKPTQSLLEFGAFVSFFPQLVAGPIERASNLLPQFKEEKKFRYYENGISGVKQILWGVFKKIVIADNCAEIVNEIFSNYDLLSGWVILYGAILFSFQIYGDFSGYSDIAIGTAKLFGFRLMQNFNFPYFSRDIAEFWRRWHISLSTWFRDYLYIPLGGSRVNTFKKVRNIFIIFVVSGIWHGANWTFVFWGAINAVLFLLLLFFKKNKSN
ncbi:MAG: membrane-bound O-acyltransferase family protein, partial [Flavobacteriales bacterium]|nr:membrane-bound O-acyltransferase family protein [Flavobacteriales bacterium]